MWVTEYSFQQRAFHVDTIERALALNLDAFIRGVALYYVPLATFQTEEAARRFCAELMEERRG